MAKYKFKEKEGVTNVMEGDTVVARYKVDYHWQEKNTAVKDNAIYIRLFNGAKKYIDCKVELNNDNIQEIPQ